MRIHQFGDLDSFGELALTTDKPRTATLITMEDCSLISITKDNFKVNAICTFCRIFREIK